jgi:uncharacterized protein (DUF885 family)
MHRAAAALCTLTLAACPAPTAPRGTTVPAPAATPSAAFAELAAAATERTYRFEPADAVSLGLHAYDGQLPDRSPAGLAAEIAALRADRDALAAVDARTLTALQRDERDVLLANARRALFELVELDQFHENPMAYAGAIDLDAYVSREYAPAPTRAAAVIRLCTALPAYLAQARANLHLPVPRTWLDTALLQTHGLADFADHDIRAALPGQPGLDPALDSCKAALVEHAAWLGKQQPTATDAYALGPEKFIAMLAETQGVTADLSRLTALADADLRRNTTALEEAARAIDPKKPVADVVHMLAAERPTPANVLEIASRDAAELRAFLIANKIVSLPTDEVAIVKTTPPFERWNSAFLDGPGPFETTKLPSFFYISPPDPTWSAEDQAAYLPPLADLVFTTVHEVYPGHFVHALHMHQSPSRVMKSFCTYSTSEGWAHYAEEMMYDAGLGHQDPRARIGMLKEALLRDVRFVVTLGEHTRGMSVDEATKLFVDRGFVDAANAKQQAVRGTFDPMYLAYTLGKLMIRKLHADWSAAHPGATLGEFHDAFLAHGCAPIPVIRRDLLGDDSPALP